MLVGMADYPGTQNDLTVSAQDAVTMKALYEANSSTTVTRILTNSEATRQNVKTAMANLFAHATSNDAVIFFFSGHGVPGGFVCYDGALRYEEVTSIMRDAAAHHKIIFADACYAGRARHNSRRVARQQQEAEQAFAQQNVMFFLSSRTNELSQERRSWSNSLFTAYLERGMRGGADANRDRTVTARELFNFVSQGVAEASGRRQHPVMWGRFDDDMPVMTWQQTNN